MKIKRDAIAELCLWSVFCSAGVSSRIIHIRLPGVMGAATTLGLRGPGELRDDEKSKGTWHLKGMHYIQHWGKNRRKSQSMCCSMNLL